MNNLIFPEGLRDLSKFTGILSLFLLNAYFPKSPSGSSVPQGLREVKHAKTV